MATEMMNTSMIENFLLAISIALIILYIFRTFVISRQTLKNGVGWRGSMRADLIVKGALILALAQIAIIMRGEAHEMNLLFIVYVILIFVYSVFAALFFGLYIYFTVKFLSWAWLRLLLLKQ